MILSRTQKNLISINDNEMILLFFKENFLDGGYTDSENINININIQNQTFQVFIF